MKTVEGKGEKQTREKPISLSPLSFEDALKRTKGHPQNRFPGSPDQEEDAGEFAAARFQRPTRA